MEHSKEGAMKKKNQTNGSQQHQQEKCNKCGDKWGGYQIACDDCGEWFHGKCVGVRDGEYGSHAGH